MSLKGVVSCVSSGFRHTMVVVDGKVFSFGFTRHGRLGLPDVEHIPSVQVPRQVPFSVRIARVACGFGHSAAVSHEGALFTWGYAGDGSLGHGPLMGDLSSPKLVTVASSLSALHFTHVSCGGCQTLALTGSGALYAAGSEAGLGKMLAGNRFKLWEDEGSVSLAFAGAKSCIVVVEERPTDIFVFGSNESNLLGVDQGHLRTLDARAPLDPTLVYIDTKAPIVQVGCGRTAALLDEDGFIFVPSSAGVWSKLKIPQRVSQFAFGAISLMFTEMETNIVFMMNQMGNAPPFAVSGMPASKMIAAGHRTFFAVAHHDVVVSNVDIYGKMRGRCRQCLSCPRYGIATEVSVNSSSGFLCARCGCEAPLHDTVEPSIPKPEPEPSSKLHSSSSATSLSTFTRMAKLEDEVDLSLPLDVCKAKIKAIQSRLGEVRHPALGKMRVFAVSDIHTDFKGNMIWLRELVEWSGDQFKLDAVIVAGDISHDLGIIETTLSLFKSAFGYVFHVCGNHELWVAPKTETVKHAYHKLLEIQEICEKIGVYCHPVVFKGENASPLVVCPLLSWYEPQFAGQTKRYAMEGFDMACRWPEDDAGVTSELLSFNDPVVSNLCKNYSLEKCTVITFTHFIPRSELFFGWPALREVMGSLRIDDQLRRLRSKLHVFGHSHMNVDRVFDGVRYVQHALGSESYHRTQSSFPHYKPKQVFP